jgi:hypothetical protein
MKESAGHRVWRLYGRLLRFARNDGVRRSPYPPAKAGGYSNPRRPTAQTLIRVSNPVRVTRGCDGSLRSAKSPDFVVLKARLLPCPASRRPAFSCDVARTLRRTGVTRVRSSAATASYLAVTAVAHNSQFSILHSQFLNTPPTPSFELRIKNAELRIIR